MSSGDKREIGRSSRDKAEEIRRHGFTDFEHIYAACITAGKQGATGDTSLLYPEYSRDAQGLEETAEIKGLGIGGRE